MNYYILGSCVSRDAFEFQGDVRRFGFLHPRWYRARYSLARLGFPRFDDGQEILEGLSSSFQRKTVEFEFKNKLLEDLAACNFDYLVIDLIDERFGLVELGPEKYLTFSDEIKRAGVDAGNLRRVIPSSEEFFNFWKSGVELLFDELRENGRLNRVVINDVLWSERLEDGRLITEHPDKRGLKLGHVTDANKLLQRQYDYLSSFPGVRFIGYPRNIFLSSLNHKWGVSSFHYVSDVYKYFIKRLTEISKGDAASRDYLRWNERAVHCDGIRGFIEELSNYRNGVFAISMPNSELKVDVLVKNFSRDSVKNYGNIILSLNGAIFNREKKNLPFFTLVELSKEVGDDVPFISISDPSLALDQSLNLAWYNGNCEIPDLLEKISALVDGIIENFNRQVNVVLVGGSGGGYAALQVIVKSKNKKNIKGLIWNPQFNITEYNLDAVRKYLYFCFGWGDDESLSKYDLNAKMIRHGLDVSVDCPLDCDVVLLLNSKDQRHIFSHLKNYFCKAYSLSQVEGGGGEVFIWRHSTFVW